MSAGFYGSPVAINRATIRPILFAGVERRLAIGMGCIVFSIAIAGNFSLTAIVGSLIGYALLHAIGIQLTKYDPFLTSILKRAMRYQRYFPAKGHALALDVRSVLSLPKSALQR